jgi:hypothetical protein
LLFRWKLGTLLELEVANGARQSQVAVDTSEVDESAGGCDSVFLVC